MTVIQIFCDRCGELIRGMEITNTEHEKITVGFYCMDNSQWCRYRKDDEAVICTKCMIQDARFQEDRDELIKMRKSDE